MKLGGILEILIISTTGGLSSFETLFKNGKDGGINISYVNENSSDCIAQAFIIGGDLLFINNSPNTLALGDKLSQLLSNANKKIVRATVFAYKVKDPERYCVVKFDKNQVVVSLRRKNS